MKTVITHTLYRPRDNSVYGNYENKEAANQAATCALIDEGIICKLVEHKEPIEKISYSKQEMLEMKAAGTW